MRVHESRLMPNKDRRPLPTFIQELVNQTRALAVLASVLRIVSWFGIGGAGLKNFTGKIDEIKREVEALVAGCITTRFQKGDGYSQSPQIPSPLKRRLMFMMTVILLRQSHY